MKKLLEKLNKCVFGVTIEEAKEELEEAYTELEYWQERGQDRDRYFNALSKCDTEKAIAMRQLEELKKRVESYEGIDSRLSHAQVSIHNCRRAKQDLENKLSRIKHHLSVSSNIINE